MRQICILIIILVGYSESVSATAQQPDVIMYKGKSYRLNSNPLEFYFKEHPAKRPKTEIINSSLWRGYVATFEVIENQVYLIAVEIEIDGMEKKKSVIEEIFPGQKIVLVDWFAGILVIPYGKRLNYVHMGYSSTYEKYILLEVGNGSINKSKEMNSDEYTVFKDQQFEIFKKTEEYLNMYKILSERDRSPESINSFLKVFATDYMKKL